MDGMFTEITPMYTHDHSIGHPMFPWSKSDEDFLDEILNRIYQSINDGVFTTLNFAIKRRDKLKKNSILLQWIFGMIIKYKNHGIPTRIIQFTCNEWKKTDIHNMNVYLKLIWINPLVMRRWMEHPIKWQILLKLLRYMLRDYKFGSRKQGVNLILTLTSSVKYWSQTQLNFIIQYKFAEIFGNYLKYVIFQNQIDPQPIFITILNVTKAVRVLCSNRISFVSAWWKPLNTRLFSKKVNNDMKSVKDTNYSIRLTTYRLKIKTEIHDFIYQNSFNEIQYSRISKTMISKKYFIDQIKKCSNDSCQIMVRLKICKRCKSVYYCSRSCQKIDWKNIHSKQCMSLAIKFKQDWIIN